MFIQAMNDKSMSGPYNAVGPYAVTNRELTKAIAKALHKPLILPFVPSLVLKLMLGELSEIVLKGSNVSSGKIVKEGFRFKFNTLENALENLLGADPKKN
jgi:NAD dependent epimerase/dehydratase family enzyme